MTRHQKTTPTAEKKIDTTIIVALITLIGTIITATLTSPVIIALLLKTPTPTSTVAPTPSQTVVAMISNPTVNPTSTASPPPPLPSPTQSCVSPTYFESVWRTHPQLGCPTNSLTSDFTFQYYQKGIMTWQKSPSPSTIYAFFNDGGWERQTNPGGPETPPCPEAQMIGRPIRGFGTLWCNNQNWRERLGVPTSDENDGKNNQIQIFQNGTIFTVGAAGGFVLYSNSRWEKF